MKRVILAGVSALAVVTMMSAANAADLPRRAAMPVKAPVYAAPFSWTGFYLGINGGGAWGRSNWSAAATDFNTSGGMVGGTVGYNWQNGPVVFGLEGDLDWSGVKGSSTCGVGVSCETRNDWLGTARGRIGYAFNRFMPYITGGLAVGNVKASTAAGSTDETRAGWALGGGIEANIAGPWSAKIEYLYADLGKTNCAACAVGGTDVSFHENIVRAGLNYRF
jgi:outer membrane immunogenic protein